MDRTVSARMTARESPRSRLDAVDVVRGVIMIIMALDHTRDFFGIPGQNPTNLATASAGLFLTRWITHFCAPVFFLLTGTGAYLALRRRSRAELSRFLLTRGLWLIFVELVVLRCLAYQFNFDFRVTMLLVLWALGWSMIVLAGLVQLPAWVSAVFAVVLIAGHNLLDAVRSGNPVWAVLHRPGFVLNTPAHVVFAAYPLIPWLGVTAAGYALAQAYAWDGERRRALLLRLGLALTAAFLLVRGLNVYGDPSRWSAQSTPLFTALSFLNVTKYPPSLAFLLMTLGPAMLFLRAVDRGTPPWLRPAIPFGRVPLFYYALHFAMIHLIGVAVCLVRYGTAHWMTESPDLGNYPFTPPPGWGFSLPVVYLVWALVVVLMYPLCRWFAALKQRRQDAWLSYL
ncbi:MAG: DUF1624 domain-containing protein [Gemmatimonadales bacterium]|nr:DUF1624 domain-containing protein [Gemmatimonadales bacterium]